MNIRVFIVAVLTAIMFALVFALTTCATGGGQSKSLELNPIKAPVAGNYPQSLYKYGLREKARNDSLPYTQTIEWSPAISKTFAANTQYTATITLEPKGGANIFKAKDEYSFTGLPETGVNKISAKVRDKNLVVSVVFEKTAAQNAETQLLFEDNFEGTSLDMDKWDINTNENRQGRSRWMKEMVSVDGGNLILKLQRDNSLGKDWIRCGAVQTRKVQPSYRGPAIFDNSYGYYEARIKFPLVRGTWGAFWLFGATVGNIGDEGVDGTEIDIIESIGNHEGRYNSALHWDGYGKEHKSTGSDGAAKPVNVYDGEFHTFALDWSPSEYVFYVDDMEFWRMEAAKMYTVTINNSTKIVSNPGIAQNPNFIIFSVEGADWAGALPQDFVEDAMLVDWVRVWNQPRN